MTKWKEKKKNSETNQPGCFLYQNIGKFVINQFAFRCQWSNFEAEPVHCRNKHHKQAQKRFFKGSFKPNGWMRKISLSEEDWIGEEEEGGGEVCKQEAVKHYLHFASIYFFFFPLVCFSACNISLSLERNG